MSREKELVKNTAILSIGKFLPKFTSFITLPILTAYLTKVEYGTYDLISTLVMLLLPIATLQIQSAAFRFLIDCRYENEKTTEIITNIFLVTVPISSICSLVVFFFISGYALNVRIAVPMYLFLDTVQLTMGQIVRGLGKNKEFSISSALLSIINMIGIVLFVYLKHAGLFGVLLSLVIAQIIAISYLLFRTNISKYVDFKYCSSYAIKEMLKYSWPMVPNNLSNWVLKLSDRLVITAALGVEVNAVYAVANKIPNLLSIAQAVLVMAWQESASIAAKDKDASEYYSKMLDTTFNLMFGCTALLIAGTPIIFWLLIKGDYADSYYQIPVLIMAMFFFVMSSYFGGIYIAHKKTVNVGVTTMVAAAINLIIDLVFVRIIGIWAGSLSTLVAYALLYFYRMISCQHFQPIVVNWKKQFLQIIVLGGMLVLCFMQKRSLNNLNLILGIVLFLYFNKNMIDSMVGNLIKRTKR